VRKLALEAGLPNHAKKDSPASASNRRAAVRDSSNRYLPKVPGAIVDEKGRTVGEHIGLAFYTTVRGRASAWAVQGDAVVRRRRKKECLRTNWWLCRGTTIPCL